VGFWSNNISLGAALGGGDGRSMGLLYCLILSGEHLLNIKTESLLSVYSDFNVYSRRENMKLPQNVYNWA
jgi:hypothetical protein